MLANGAGLVGISQVLRHPDPAITAIDARVDDPIGADTVTSDHALTWSGHHIDSATTVGPYRVAGWDATSSSTVMGGSVHRVMAECGESSTTIARWWSITMSGTGSATSTRAVSVAGGPHRW